jgi:hypothetical protein
MRAAGWVIDAVAPTSRSTPFKTAKLSYQLAIIEHIDHSRIDYWQQVPVQVRLRLCRGLVGNPMFSEAFAWPLACITVTSHPCDAVGLEARR